MMIDLIWKVMGSGMTWSGDEICIYIYIYIFGGPPPKTYVSYKNTAIYSVSRTFSPLDFGSFFGGHHMYNIKKIHNM